MIYFPWCYSDEYLATLKQPEPYQTELMADGNGWAKAWDANALLIRYATERICRGGLHNRTHQGLP